MQFLNKEDFLSLIDEQTLEVITDSNDALLDESEGRAIEEMNAYLNTRYDTDDIFNTSNRNGLIVMYLCDIVLYHLHARISPDNIPELRKERYTNAKEWLEKAADGFISPLLPKKQDDDKIPLRYGSSIPKQNHYY